MGFDKRGRETAFSNTESEGIGMAYDLMERMDVKAVFKDSYDNEIDLTLPRLKPQAHPSG